MNLPFNITAFDFRSHAASYRHDEDIFRAIKNEAVTRLLAYHPTYGHYVVSHLARGSENFEKFMLAKAYDPEIAKKLAGAFGLHDIEKLAQEWPIHVPTSGKPTEYLLERRKDHTRTDGRILKEIISDLRLTLSNDDHGQMTAINLFSKLHHERLDGSGPHGLIAGQMDEPLRIGTLIDEVDGKAKLEKHTLVSIFDDIFGIREKFKGKFDLGLAEEYRDFCKRAGLYSDAELKSIRVPLETAPAP